MISSARSKPLFTSARERRLWVWTLAVVAAIYSTLGLARTLAGELRNRDLLDAAFVVGALLVGVTIVTLALQTRPGGTEIGVALGVAAAYLMVFIRMGIPEERTHLIEYGIVAAFIYEALIERARQGRRVPTVPLIAVVATALLGALDESIQALLPGRVFDPADILVNLIAGAMAVAASVALRRARGRKSLQ